MARRLASRGLPALVIFWPALCGADTALIAVASNFAEVAESLVRDFENLSEHEIEISAASTGNITHKSSMAHPTTPCSLPTRRARGVSRNLKLLWRARALCTRLAS